MWVVSSAASECCLVSQDRDSHCLSATPSLTKVRPKTGGLLPAFRGKVKHNI